MVIRRFGSIRVFVTCFVLFGVFSVFCGLATSMTMLVAFRVFWVLVGGPIDAFIANVDDRIFPK